LRAEPGSGLINLMSEMHSRSDARAGDQLDVQGLHGGPTRRGEIVEVLGRPGHERYRVRWDEQHESIVYPADGVSVIHPGEAEHSPRG
jgi:hypothetical protein